MGLDSVVRITSPEFAQRRPRP